MVASTHGEEFRDDLRGTAAAAIDARAANGERAAAVNVRKLLPPEILAELTRMSAWRSSLAIAQTFILLALPIAIAWNHFTFWIVVPAVVLIGIQQHALFVLAHDAAHYRLFERHWLNELLGRLFGTV